MGLPECGSRIIVVDGRRLRWLVRYDRSHWRKGLCTPVRVVVADAEQGGSRLVAEFEGGRRFANEQLREPFAPRCVRRLIDAGLRAGWVPGAIGRRDLRLGQSEVEACDPQGDRGAGPE